MERVVVLGATGMLGSMVWRYLQQAATPYEIWGTVRAPEQARVAGQPHFIELDASSSDSELERALAEVKPHWIINCIGIIKPYCQDDDPAGVRNAIVVNALFPYRLATIAQKLDARIIQIATDCVYSGREGKYIESAPHDALDAYGKTKSLGEVAAPNMLHIRCSIIGPEPWAKMSLLEWFLHQPEGSHIQGFTHHQWNGITTLQFAQCCHQIIMEGEDFFIKLVTTSSVHHYIPNETINKFDLLSLFAQIFNKQVTVGPTATVRSPVDRSLATKFKLLTAHPGEKRMAEALKELKDYVDANPDAPFSP